MNAHEDVFQKVILGLLSHRDLDELLENIIKSAGQIVNTEHGYIDLVDEEKQILNTRVATGLFKNLPRRPVKKGEGFSGLVWESQQPQIIEDYDAWQHRLPTFKHNLIKSSIGIPLKSGQRVIGLLILVHEKGSDKSFGQNELEALQSYASLAALAIENIRLYQSALQAAERRTILHHTTQEISASLRLEEVCTAIHRATKEIMSCEDFFIILYDEPRDRFLPVYLIERDKRISAAPFDATRGMAGHVFRTQRSLLLNNPQEIEQSGIQFQVYGSPEGMTQSILAVPMKFKNKITGIISTQSYQPHAYSEDDKILLEMLGAHAAIAFENARLFEQAERLAAIDSLTGLLNRRHFFELAEREFKRSSRYGRPLSAVMLDIDQFKNFNDTYGHQSGDKILSVIANISSSVMREVDIIGRYGGDEFVALLPETKVEEAVSIAQRLQTRARSARIPIKKRLFVSVSISIGIAAMDKTHENVAALIHHADEALYRSKRSGRDKISVWSR